MTRPRAPGLAGHRSQLASILMLLWHLANASSPAISLESRRRALVESFSFARSPSLLYTRARAPVSAPALSYATCYIIQWQTTIGQQTPRRTHRRSPGSLPCCFLASDAPPLDYRATRRQKAWALGGAVTKSSRAFVAGPFDAARTLSPLRRTSRTQPLASEGRPLEIKGEPC